MLFGRMGPSLERVLAFLMTWAYLGLGGFLGLTARQRGKLTAGTLVWHQPAPLRSRLIVSAAVVVLGAIALASYPSMTGQALDGLLPTPAALASTLVLSLVVYWGLPHPAQAACGETGVRFGWRSCFYGELDSWRLTGEHLRCCIAGKWYAMRVPPEAHAALRRHLEREAGSLESEFSDRKG